MGDRGAGNHVQHPSSGPTSGSTAVRIALVLTLLVVLIGSVRFGRFDWSGIPFERYPMTVERVIDENCTEFVRPYTTDRGRLVAPVATDEQQYMSMVDHFRGTPRDELHVTCMLDPFVSRPAAPWLASWLPLDEGAALGTVNLAMVLLATWCVVFTLRAQGFGARVVAVGGALFAVGWNTLFFSSGILIDAGVVALIALGWLLLALRRPWLLVPLLAISYPFKETVALVLLPVLAVWLWGAVRAGRRGAGGAVALLVAAIAASVLSVVASRALFLSADATWEVLPSVAAFVNNVFDPVGLASFTLAVGPIGVPAVLAARQRWRRDGWWEAATNPAVLGIAIAAVLCLWVALAADFSARFAWVGFPFAATLAAEWFSAGRAGSWLDRRRWPGWLEDRDAAAVRSETAG